MSHRTYDEKWHMAQRLLSVAVQKEIPQLDRRQHRPQLAELYLRYIVIANKLSECVDQLVQPQKRKFARRLLELVLGRVLELKTDLVESDLCDYTYTGSTMDALHLTPELSELKVPNCFKFERKEELEYNNTFIDTVLEKLGFLDVPTVKEQMSDIEAIKLIQAHERARQGRLRAQFMKEIKMLKDKSKPAASDETVEDERKISFMAALCIQKIWRGYITRRMTRKKKIQEMLLIGMLPPPKTQSKEIDNAEEVWNERLELQEKRAQEYLQSIENCKEKLQKTQRGPLLEQLSDQVRGWLYEYKEQTGKIPEYTGSERSTSRMMLSRQGTDSELSKSTGTEKSSKDSKGKSKKNDKGKEGKQNGDDEEEEDTKAIVSSFLTEITTKNEEYEEQWKNKDESSNPFQYHYDDIIYNDQMAELENELRKVVDDMMRAELQMLQDALDRDKGYKGKKPKKASKKSRRGGKKSKKKKEKDLTPDRTTESLFEEMVANGIIRKYPPVYFKDFIGERSHCNHAPFNSGKEQPIAIGDLRQLLIEYCVLPLSSPILRESTPIVRSLLLAGYHGSGKDMLVNAICTETGAVLFDLSPANIVGKYPGKSGLTMLLHLVSKVSRLLQPAVIYMDSAEKPFMKKTAKGDKTDPKRLKKDLPKLVKGICPEDQVMLIGITTCPWESDQKLLQQVYQKFILIPRPDYSARYAMWQYLLGQFKAIGWQFDISAMSKISDGFTLGAISHSVSTVITVKRMVQLLVHPLNPAELVNVLSGCTPVYREEEEAMLAWWTRAPLARRRQRAAELAVQLKDAKQNNHKE